MEKKLKIYFLNIYQGEVERGAERFVLELSSRLSDKFDVKVIAGKKKEIKRWPFLWRLYLDPSGLRICLFTLKNLFQILKEKPDVVIPINGGWMPYWIRLVTWMYGGKMVNIGNAGIGWDDRVNLWSFPNTFVAISTRAEKWAKKVNPFVKVKKILNGIDTKLFNPNVKPIKVNLPGPIILGVGALDSWKRWYLAIRAVSNLKEGSLLLVGKGRKKKALRKMGENLLPGRFAIKSFPPEKMPSVYTSADLFTYPTSPEESFGLVLLEAMASNLAVVATNDSIRKEIVGNAGILVDPTNGEEYSNGIKKTLNTKWGEKPRNQAGKFDWKRVVEKYGSIFREL